MKYTIFILSMLCTSVVYTMDKDREIEIYWPMIEQYCRIESADMVPDLADLRTVLADAQNAQVQSRAKLILGKLYIANFLEGRGVSQEEVVGHLNDVLTQGFKEQKIAARLKLGRICLQQENYAAARVHFQAVEPTMRSLPRELANEVRDALTTINNNE